ncbi:acetyl-CoA C-acetyltransferase [Pelagibacteraceae bacterium]|jgi:acetyl-CoA C-acetyltransferase|nr:acetyl-CoA C-acetyltransferase [Pelagibacteraceae bacterium]
MDNKKKNIVITSAARTAIGTYRGSLKNVQAYELGSVVVKEVMEKSNLNSNDVDELIMGQVLTGSAGQNPARQAAIKAGLPINKTAYIINQVCGSGLRSVASAYQAIMSNDSSIIIAGGQESMTNAPHAINFRNGKKLNEENLIDTMIKDGLWDAFNNYHMGITAENVASKWEISRKEQDDFALLSQSKAKEAQKEGKFKNEIVPIILNSENKKFEIDEHPRSDMTLERLEKLKASFKKNGTVTPGNSSGLNDGAAAVVLMDESEAAKRNLKPLAKIVSWATCGVEPSLMGSGPIPATKEALKKATWKISDLDLVESNEAFAAQSLAVIKDLGIPKEKVNVNGGAIALGHPIGASGTRVLVTLLHEMKKRNSKKGLATLCIGGGMGIAMCLECNF